MEILVVGSTPYEGVRRRQQQVARGLARAGHRVVHLDPPVAVRALLGTSPSALEDPPPLPADAHAGPAHETGHEAANGAAPGAAAGDVAARIEQLAAQAESDPERLLGPPESPAGAHAVQIGRAAAWQAQERLAVARRGIALAGMGRWGWASRAGWKLWGVYTRALIRQLQSPPPDGAGERFQPDVTLVYHPALLPAVRAVTTAPVVFDCVEDFPALATSRSIASAYEDALTAGIPIADGFVAVNRYILGSWGRLLRADVPSAVIEHGVDLEVFCRADRAARARARAQLEIDDALPVAAYLGRVDARLSFEDLERILDVEPRLLLLLLGEVAAEGAAILQRLPAERVRHIGPLRQPDAAQLLAAADLLLIPFRREPELESIRGLKLYEYLATGLPVVASFRRGMKAFRELIELYTTWPEMEAALGTALAEDDAAPARNVRVAAAREAGWERRGDEMEAFLHRVVASGPGKRAASRNDNPAN